MERVEHRPEWFFYAIAAFDSLTGMLARPVRANWMREQTGGVVLFRFLSQLYALRPPLQL